MAKLISRYQDQFGDEIDRGTDMAERYDRLTTFKGFEERGWGSQTQLEAMDVEGIDLALLFPSLGLFAHAKVYDDDELAAAVSRAYNNWLAEFCQADNTRMFGSGMIPAQNVEAAIHEVRRVKEELGFKAVFLRPQPRPR